MNENTKQNWLLVAAILSVASTAITTFIGAKSSEQ